MTTNGQQQEQFPELGGAGVPTRLEEAHWWLSGHEVSPTASLEEQRHYHALAAEVYRLVAGTDPISKDRVRAREWARAEQDQAGLLAARIAVHGAFASYLGPDFDQPGFSQHIGGV